jgi:peptide/nickel transport system substrate-binding protein
MKTPTLGRLRVAALAVICLAALVVAGCGGNSSTNGGSAATGNSSDTAPTQKGGVLNFGVESYPTTLDPSRVVEAPALLVDLQVFEGLYEINGEGEVLPNLAAGSKTSPDGLTWTFPLRKGVTFSNGNPMTSKDVVFSIEQARKSPIFANLYEGIKAVTAPNPTTVVIKTKTKSPALLPQLSLYAASIVPDNYAGMSEKEFAQKPIATGPFMVSSTTRGSAIKLVKNPHAWKEPEPRLDEIVFHVVTDETSRLAQLRAGELEAVKSTPLANKTGVPPGSGIRIEEGRPNAVYYLLLNQNDASFEDPQMRKAINLALDREGISKTAFGGKGELGSSFLPPTVLYYDDIKPPARDIAEAKKLVSEATKAGADPTFTIRYYDFDAPSGLATQIVQQNLEEIGLKVKLQPLDEAALNELIEDGEYEAVFGLFGPVIADPSEQTTFYLSFYAPGNGADVAAQTKVANEALTELNSSKREALYKQLQEMVAEEESMLIVNYAPGTYPVAESVSGIEFDALGNPLLREAGFTQ